MTKLSKNIVDESSLNIAYQHSISHDTGFITAYRDEFANEVNKSRNKALEASFASEGYGITIVRGFYIQKYGTEDAIEVGESLFFVVDYRDRGGLKQNLVALGEKFDQDSVLFVEKGGDKSKLIGTNDSIFPGRDKIKKYKNAIYRKNGEFITRVNGRPFVFKGRLNKAEIKHSCNIMGQWAAHSVARGILRELNMPVD